MADPRGNPLNYLGVKYSFPPTYIRDRAPLISDVSDDQGLYKVPSIWIHQKNLVGPVDADVWILVDLQANNANGATWLLFTGGTGGSVTELRADDGNVATPLAGIIDINGNIVTNGTIPNPLFTRANIANTVDIDLQLATTVTPTPADANDAGIASFNENHFTIDPISGMVSLSGGGIAADQFDVDANTAPGTDPVVPSGSGEVGIFGALVAAHSVPIETHSRAANQFNIEPQIASAAASSTLSSNGMSHYDSAAFSVDADGFVQLLGGGTPAISFETDDGAPNVVPNGSGEIEIVGGANVTTSGQGPGNVITIDAIIPANNDNFTNIGFDYSSPTFSITSQDGTALSASNKATVTFNSKASAGTQVTIDVTANQSFEDSSGTSDIVNNLFGLFTGDNWGANDIPFFVFAVLNDNEDDVTFMISRMPWMPKSPSSTEIGTPASADADEQYSFFALRSITTTEYDENPVVYIGCFRMRFTQPGGNDDWTVQALTLEDGPKKNYNNKLFDFPQNVNGAAASSWYRDVGGTAPVFNNGFYKYRIMSDGTYDMRYNNQDLTNSATATGASLTLPYSYGLGTAFGDPAIGTGWVKDGAGAPKWFIFGHPINQQTFTGIMAWNATTLDSDADPATLWTGTGATRLIYLNMSYSVDTNFNN